MECPLQPALRAVANPKHGQEVSRPAPSPCPGREGADLNMKLAVLLVILTGLAVLFLLYRLLQLRHRLKMARARHALEYYGFYHSATYRLRHIPLYEDNADTGSKTSSSPTLVAALPPPTVVVSPLPPVPSPPMRRLPPEQATPLFGHPLVSQTTSLLLPPPISLATPPSPHLSWGACSDADLYSRIGTFRSSRVSSLSSQSRVILFEHSAL